MSVRHIAGVLDMRLPPGLKLVALIYADSTNVEDGVVFLSIPKVAERSGYSRRRTQELTRDLESAGILTALTLDAIPPTALERLAGIPTRRWPTVYRLTLEPDPPTREGRNPRTPNRGTGGAQSSPVRGATSDTSGVRPVAPKPEEEPEGEPWARSINYTAPRRATPTTTPHVWKLDDVAKAATGIERRDLLFEAVADECRIDLDELTDDGRRNLNGCVKQLRDVAADPIEVRRRSDFYRSGNAPGIPRGTKLTARALVSHWASLKRQNYLGAVPDGSPDRCPPHEPVPAAGGGSICALCDQPTTEEAS